MNKVKGNNTLVFYAMTDRLTEGKENHSEYDLIMSCLDDECWIENEDWFEENNYLENYKKEEIIMNLDSEYHKGEALDILSKIEFYEDSQTENYKWYKDIYHSDSSDGLLQNVARIKAWKYKPSKMLLTEVFPEETDFAYVLTDNIDCYAVLIEIPINYAFKKDLAFCSIFNDNRYKLFDGTYEHMLSLYLGKDKIEDESIVQEVKCTITKNNLYNYLSCYNGSYEDVGYAEWQNRDDDMINLSTKYPAIRFELYSDGRYGFESLFTVYKNGEVIEHKKGYDI